jgi:outer membrane protein TolC
MQHLWNNVEDAYQQMQIAQKAIAQSTENLRLNENYYKAGMTTMSDLLDAQSLFQQSRDKWVDTYSNFQLAKLEYRQATAQD